MAGEGWDITSASVNFPDGWITALVGDGGSTGISGDSGSEI